MYKVNDIFLSLQGEGVNTGRAAVFVRFALCNRRCSYCDTDFVAYTEMTAEEILSRIAALWADSNCTLIVDSLRQPLPMVVLTGGEPAIQVDPPLIDALHRAGYYIAIETNGSLPLPEGIDWITVSPKGDHVITECDELKVIFTDASSADDCNIRARHYCLQPCDTGDPVRNKAIVEQCIAYIKSHPRWRLSLQTHKIMGYK